MNTNLKVVRVEEVFLKENQLGLTNHLTFVQFKDNCERYRNNLLEILK